MSLNCVSKLPKQHLRQSLVAAGYVLYSASTELVLTFGQGVVGFTLDTSTLLAVRAAGTVIVFVHRFSVNIIIYYNRDMLYLYVYFFPMVLSKRLQLKYIFLLRYMSQL